MSFNQDGTDKNGCVGLDAPRVRRADAITLMVHHLSLAAMYFEAIPDDLSDAEAEISAVFNAYDGDPKYEAAWGWLQTINAGYEKLKDNDR